jgi:hypothetical protein
MKSKGAKIDIKILKNKNRGSPIGYQAYDKVKVFVKDEHINEPEERALKHNHKVKYMAEITN